MQKTSDGAVGHEGRGHRGGFGIDIRYPNSMMHFGEIDAFDSSGRYNHVIKMRTWVNELKDHYALGSSHTALEDICSDASNQLIANECFNLGKIGSKYLIQSVVKFCHLVSEKLNEADYRSVCKEFPVSSAKILSINTAEIRRAVDAISATSNRTNVIIGKGEDNWLWGLVSRGEFTPGFNLIEYDTQHNVFNDQFMPTWQNGAVHYTPRGHSGHIHLDLE